MRKFLASAPLILVLSLGDAYGQDTDWSVFRQMSLVVCNLNDWDGPPPTKADLNYLTPMCEKFLQPRSKDILRQSRNCYNTLNAKFQLPGSPERVHEIATHSRYCAQEINRAHADWQRPVAESDRALWEFVPRLVYYFNTAADEFAVLRAFNEAVDRNDARILHGLVSSLVTLDARKLIPSTVTTSMLSARYQRLREELPARMNSHVGNLTEAERALLMSGGIRF